MELTKVICSTPEDFSKECNRWAGKGVVRGRKLIAYGVEVAELITQRGGKREGAGRKAPDGARVAIAARVTPQTKAKLEQMQSESGKGLGVLLDELIGRI